MRDHVIAAVRTAVAAAVTGIVAWLAGVGINLDPSALEAVLGALAVGVAGVFTVVLKIVELAVAR